MTSINRKLEKGEAKSEGTKPVLRSQWIGGQIRTFHMKNLSHFFTTQPDPFTKLGVELSYTVSVGKMGRRARWMGKHWISVESQHLKMEILTAQ